MWLTCKSQRRKERLAPAPIWEECDTKEKGTGGKADQGEKKEHETQSHRRDQVRGSRWPDSASQTDFLTCIYLKYILFALQALLAVF